MDMRGKGGGGDYVLGGGTRKAQQVRISGGKGKFSCLFRTAAVLRAIIQVFHPIWAQLRL